MVIGCVATYGVMAYPMTIPIQLPTIEIQVPDAYIVVNGLLLSKYTEYKIIS